jgi:RNA polymerase sigma-32 factor
MPDDKKNSVDETQVDDLIVDKNLPVVPSAKDMEVFSKSGSIGDPLVLYLREISRFKLLSREEEEQLTKEFVESGDLEVAKQLVQANLRLVVKIAMEYRNSYQNILDLIQEGNVGLMRAVSMYDPTKGAKLSYYASWWIKSYILKFLLDNFRLIKIGTTADQKKLFYNLSKERDRLAAQGIVPDTKMIAENLGVSEKSVELMSQRLSSTGGEVSLDTPIGEDKSSTLGDTIIADDQNLEDMIGHNQEIEILKDNLGEFIGGLKERDKEIFEARLMSEVPLSLQAIADNYGVSRERIRQIEERLLKSLKEFMQPHLR